MDWTGAAWQDPARRRLGEPRHGKAGQGLAWAVFHTAFSEGIVITKLHPFDFEALRKGTWIETSELEEATSAQRDDVRFALLVLGVRDQIEKQTGILSRVEGQRLRLMTDGEAMVWTIKQAAEASRKLERSAVRMTENIDTALLTSTEQVVQEHAQRVITAMALAQRSERQKGARLFALTSAEPRVATAP
jgi:hypothetical protein